MHSRAAGTREQVKKLKGHWTPRPTAKHLMHCPTESQENSPAMLPPEAWCGSSRAHKEPLVSFWKSWALLSQAQGQAPALTVAAFFPSSPAPPPPPGSTCLSFCGCET